MRVSRWRKSGRLVEDAVPSGRRGELCDGLRGAQGGHPLGVVGACGGFGLGRLAVRECGGGLLVAEDDAVLNFDLEGRGAEGLARSCPADLEEGGDAGRVERESGLDRQCVQIEDCLAGGRKSEKVGVRKRGLECDGGLRACDGRDGHAVFHENNFDGDLVAAF